MRQREFRSAWFGALLVILVHAATGDEMTPTSYASDFEPGSGYFPGLLAPGDPIDNQPGGAEWWANWLDSWAHGGVVVTNEQAHSGSQALKFTGNPANPEDLYSSASHITVLAADPCDPNEGSWRPAVWRHEFWVYVPWLYPNQAIVLRAEPWNNWTRLCGDLFGQWEGYAYQFFIYRINDGLADGWRPQIGIDARANDLRDELGLDPVSGSFACDQWWKISIVADGQNYTVSSVAVSDDLGHSFTASGLSDCFSSWGEPCPGAGGDNYCSRPERVTYYGRRDLVLDDVSLRLVEQQRCPADFNGDGAIGLSDLAILLSHFGGPGGPTDGDLDGNGQITLSDLAGVLSVFGTSCP